MSTNRDNQLELLRSNIMEHGGVEEKVEVNQRHLIDKILARYSAEYVLYRELMQNADDASSSSIQIHFHTSHPDPTKPPNLLSKCTKIVFKNNGIPFRPEDWQRLKRIAEGNPDEQKIGAFGVGFYSLFSVCENPFVFSGSQCMAFYFKGDQLFAKRADVSENQMDNWTSFLMDLREPMEMPDFEQFSKFLTTSMGFTANLKNVSVFFDNVQIFNLTKRLGEPRAMAVDARKMILHSPQRMFTITGSEMQQIQLDAEKYTPPSLFSFATFLSKPKDVDPNALPMEKGSIFLRVVTCKLQVSVSRDYEKEMERATKKKPPKSTKFQLVYTGKEELDASENKNQIFKDLIPFPNQGRVFIGFPTHQTTGCCCHMASRFIPTVERESIDFADRYISVWNKELLAVGGLLARLVYNDEMDQITRLYRELVGSDSEIDKSVADEEGSARLMLQRRAAHALHSFTFQNSTPSSIVGKMHEERFFNSCKVALDIMTSHGVQPITVARTIPDSTTLTGHVITELLDKFIKIVPTITPIMLKECKESMTKLTGFQLLSPLGINDVLRELDQRSLKEDEMVACMKWWIECNKGNVAIPSATRTNINDTVRAQFLGAAVMDCGEALLQLSQTKWFINPKIIPLNATVPPNTMPFSISKHFNAPDLATFFGNITELTVFEWVKFIAVKPDLESSAEFAERVLTVVSKQYQHISNAAQNDIIGVLKVKKCIPTRYGLKVPSAAYFPSVNLFDDLPVIEFKAPRSLNETFLTSLGVRKHVELQLVFDRLISDGSWSHVELVKYLTGVQSTLSELETRRLRETAIFTKEGEEPTTKEVERPTGMVDEAGKPILQKVSKKVYKRYRASDLFAPTEIARDLKLPLLYWSGTRWKASSDEAKFMEKLGLVVSPNLQTLLALAAPDTKSNDRSMQNRALNYFIEHYSEYRSQYDVKRIQTQFLPCADGKTYAAPRDCFTNPDVTLLGFQVLHKDFIPVRDKLGVSENPDADRLVKAFLARPELDPSKAKRIFEYMAGRMGDFNNMYWNQLRPSAFIPVQASSGYTLKEPNYCYFESESSASFHKELFLFVNFGPLANSFLRSCGVRDEPNTVELATMLVKDPQRFWDLSSGGERYLNVIRQIASQFYMIKANRQLMNDMKSKAFLVGIKRTTMTPEEEAKSADEEFVQYRLAKATDIFIIDEPMGQQIFSPLSAPMEPSLEEFYASLGSSRLSTQIKESYSYAQGMGVTERSKSVTEMIFERTPIIIYQMVNDVHKRRKELIHDEKYVQRHLKVMQAKDLKITRVFKYTGEKNVQLTTACADRVNFGIFISDAKEIDYYDIAMALCNLLFAKVQFNDAIIAERYLTASLYNLRRKGVPVDRILNLRKHEQQQKQLEQQQQQKQAIEAARATPDIPKKAATPPPAPPPLVNMPKPLSSREMDKCTKQVQDVFGDCQEGYIRQLLAQQQDNHAQNVIERLLREDYPKKNQVESPNSIVSEEEQEAKKKQVLEANKKENERNSGFVNRLWSSWKQPAPTPPKPPIETKPVIEPKKPKLPKSEKTITPNYTNNVRENLKRAIHSCKPFAGQDIYTPPRINNINESASYCDATPGQNLTYVGNVLGMEFYVHRDVNPDDVLELHKQAMTQFNSILKELATVFDLKLSTIQIFYDTEGPTIAFNTSGSLFMNLRYYLALHSNQRKEALIYWFMTLCHELAHNFVTEHSSQHEFYMSSFAENYLEALMAHIYNIEKDALPITNVK